MGDFELLRFANPEDLTQRTTEDWLADIQESSANQALYCVALPGGRIAGRVFSAVADRAKANAVSFDRVHFFWGDERCVPPTDAESNFALAQSRLLIPLQIPDRQVHRICGEEEPFDAAAHATQQLRNLLTRSHNAQPVLDLILLGLGEDGHVASLFPGEPEAVLASPTVYRPVIGAKPPPRRITLGYATIAAARKVWVLASGAGKEAALRESLRSNGDTPLARVVRQRQRTRILTDLADSAD